MNKGKKRQEEERNLPISFTGQFLFFLKVYCTEIIYVKFFEFIKSHLQTYCIPNACRLFVEESVSNPLNNERNNRIIPNYSTDPDNALVKAFY